MYVCGLKTKQTISQFLDNLSVYRPDDNELVRNLQKTFAVALYVNQVLTHLSVIKIKERR